MQPADAPEDSTQYVKGSFFAVVQEGSTVVGPDVPYLVKKPDGSTETVPRHRLRHRLWHHVAFLGVTNEKQHVATSTQTFFARQLEFWRLWNDRGRNAAHAFASNDRATMPPPATAEEAATRAEMQAEVTAEEMPAAEETNIGEETVQGIRADDHMHRGSRPCQPKGTR